LGRASVLSDASPFRLYWREMQTRQKSRKTTRAITTQTGVVVETAYCRMCRETKNASDYYVATDVSLDTNGLMSICKQCCQTLYENNLKIENSIERALYKTCRVLNIRYDEDAIAVAKQQIKNMNDRGTNATNFFGIYKSKLLAVTPKEIGHRGDEDFTFQEETPLPPPSESDVEFQKSNEDLAYFWGENLQEEDYSYLERELGEWRATHKYDTKAEKSLIKEICLISLAIRRERAGGNPHPKALVTELQNLMKTASVDPAKTASANSGKTLETFSDFVKIIENNEPAEYYQDKKLFKDFDGLDFYFKKYVTRPLKNFITQSRDFNVEGEDDVDELVDGDNGD
jgi:hypothetical protein